METAHKQLQNLALARDTLSRMFAYHNKHPDIPLEKRFRQCKKEHRRSGGHWFDKEAMRLFGTRVLDTYGPVFAFRNRDPAIGDEPEQLVHGIGVFHADDTGLRVSTQMSPEQYTPAKVNRLAKYVHELLQVEDVPYGSATVRASLACGHTQLAHRRVVEQSEAWCQACKLHQGVTGTAPAYPYGITGPVACAACGEPAYLGGHFGTEIAARDCDGCGRVEHACHAPDWPLGLCEDCD